MPILTADNRNLLSGTKFTYLSKNYSSGQTTIQIDNPELFKPDDFILLGDFGSNYTEIRKITSIDSAASTITISYSTNFAHSESTKITIISYDQIRFFYTTDTTFSAGTPLYTYVLMGDETTQIDITNTAGTTFRYTYDTTGTSPHFEKYIRVGYTIKIDAEDFTAANNGTFVVTAVDTNYFEITNATGVAEANKTIGTGYIKVNTNYLDIETISTETKFSDFDNSTGFGWFVFYNSETAVASQNSNAIPYAGFESNSVMDIIKSFYSLLNNKEQKLITEDDAFRWLNEGYSIAINELNLSNKEYTVSDEYTVSTSADIKEYSLPSAFSDLISIVVGDSNVDVGYIPLQDVPSHDGVTSNSVGYYLRGDYIGFSPTPSSAIDYTIRYVKKTTVLNSMYDNVEFPDNNYYCLVDWMMFRASKKLGRMDGANDKAAFDESIQRMKMVSIKRDANRDSWSIDAAANI